ncbi:MAG: Hsp70 family protein [Candidatus Saccharicenans sp.]|uniref:Hsp70 family protein n=1 Tax=Candidatus Saccharicenans sp. TaxID=2819258 RepID=UPI00404AD99D
MTWAEKKRGLEPQLLGTAEALKEAICREIDRLKKFGKYHNADKNEIVVRQPEIICHIGRRSFRLENPDLSAAKWEELLKPFIDPDLLYARETEYRLTQSIFAPLQDALDRAGLSPKEVDFCLMVGGSSLIPQVREAVENYFKNSVVGYLQDPSSIYLSVARGAALNSLFKEITGRNLVQPVLNDGLSLVTSGDELYCLVPIQSRLPYPENKEWARVELLARSNSGVFTDKILLKVVSERDRQPLLLQIWNLPEAVEVGSEIIMEYRITAGKQFICRAFLKEKPDMMFELNIENPLVNVVNPGKTQLAIMEKEEELRRK